jgi:hypothetical protein
MALRGDFPGWDLFCLTHLSVSSGEISQEVMIRRRIHERGYGPVDRVRDSRLH